MENWEKDDTFLAKWQAGELSEEERIAFEQSKAFKEFQAISNTASAFKVPEFNVEQSLATWKEKRRSQSIRELPGTYARIKTFSRMQKLSLAATVLIGAVVSFLYFQSVSISQIEYVNGFGSVAEVTLPDGSEVILGSNSRLRYDESDWHSNREVFLSGEAYFKVENGENFEVITDLGTVSVLGTEFNVKSRNGFFDTTCYEGRVEVKIDEEIRELTAGEEIRYQLNREIQERTFEGESEPTWVNGIISLKEVPLKVALQELEAQFGIEGDFETISDTLIYTGSFPGDDAESAIRLVMEPFGFRYNFDENTKQLTIYK